MYAEISRLYARHSHCTCDVKTKLRLWGTEPFPFLVLLLSPRLTLAQGCESLKILVWIFGISSNIMLDKGNVQNGNMIKCNCIELHDSCYEITSHYYHINTALLPRYYRITTGLLPNYYRITTALLPRYYRITTGLLPNY